MDEKIHDEVNSLIIEITDALIGGLPAVSSGQKLYKIYKSYNESFFIEKIETFLQNRGRISDSQRQRFIDSLDENHIEFEKKLLISIDRIDSKEKAEILGKVFRGILKRGLPGTLYLELAFMINSCHLQYLKYFLSKSWETDQGIEPESVVLEFQRKTLSNLGFLNQKTISTTQMGRSHLSYEYSESHLGSLIYSLYRNPDSE